MTFLKLFLICIFKNQNLADIFTNFAEKKKKKMEHGISIYLLISYSTV